MRDGKSDSKIEKKKYLGRNDLIEFEIPSGIVEVEDWAFAQCEHLRIVRFPNTIQRVGKNVFLDCPNLKDIFIDGISKELSRILAYAFEYFDFCTTCDISSMNEEQWMEKYDENLILYLNTPDDVGFAPFLAGGEEDYQDEIEARQEYEDACKLKKCFMIFERLSLCNACSVKQDSGILYNYLKHNIDTTLQVLLLETEKPLLYYGILVETDILEDDIRQKLLSKLDERHVELKALLLADSSNTAFKWNDFQL